MEFLKRAYLTIKRRIIKGLCRRYMHDYYFEPYHCGPSYSQEGEDRIIASFFASRLQRPGFYVDVGAHHPYRFSNTSLFYQLGWKGINIDPLPGTIACFNKERPRDLTIEIAVTSHGNDVKIYIFDESALSGTDRNLADSRIKEGKFKLSKTKLVKSIRLVDVFSNFIPPEQQIDFLSIDAEGSDLDILKSNDWSKFRPTLVLVEDLPESSSDRPESETSAFLRNVGYALIARTPRTLFFEERGNLTTP